MTAGDHTCCETVGGHRPRLQGGSMQSGSNPELELIKALGNSDWRVRRQAAGDLLRVTDGGSLPEVIRRLRYEHRDPSMLNSVLQVLVGMGPVALPAVVELTRDSDGEVRMYAALALGDLNDHRAIPTLSSVLNDPDANVKYHAIEALA